MTACRSAARSRFCCAATALHAGSTSARISARSISAATFPPTIDEALAAIPGVKRTGEPPVDGQRRSGCDAGELGAIYTGRMEYGPRALGARTILANPSRRETHDLLNQRLARSEFMPFAPVIRPKRRPTVFDINSVNARACRYMTIALRCAPGLADAHRRRWCMSTSRRGRRSSSAPTTRSIYDIITGFERETGLPALVNTSFNVHEEPIVNTPAQCVKRLIDGRMDFVVTGKALYDRAGARRSRRKDYRNGRALLAPRMRRPNAPPPCARPRPRHKCRAPGRRAFPARPIS